VPSHRLLSPRALGAIGVAAAVALIGAGATTGTAAPAAATVALAASAPVDDAAVSDTFSPDDQFTLLTTLGDDAAQMPTTGELESVAAAALATRTARAASRAAARQAWNDKFVYPVRGFQLSAGFGDAGGRWSSRHTGLDFRAPLGTPVYAAADAVVLRTTYHPAYGKMIVLSIGRGITLWYCHLSRISVHAGERVAAADRIGAVGRTGNTTGPHLHFEVRKWDRPTDPAVFLFSSTQGYTGRVPSWVYTGRIETLATL
jgi:murein DD-endopeptidase MepM/ murein hydrolase activator NlpD